MHLRSLIFVISAVALGSALPGRAASLVCDLEQSRIEVAVKATVDSFTGRLTKFDLGVTLDPAGKISTAQLRFRFADVQTGKDKRDLAMHEWQQTDRFPDGEFVLDSLVPESGGTWRASGRLTLHGRTQPLAFPVAVVTEGELCAIDGEAVVDTREFGLPVIRMLGLLKVDPLVRVRFHLQGRQEAKP